MQYRCSLTGVDEDTSFSQLNEFSKEFPFIEWGILYSTKKSGNHPRYPTMDFIKSFGYYKKVKKLNTALHLCGDIAEAYFNKNYNTPIWDFESGCYGTLRDVNSMICEDHGNLMFDRTQINVNLSQIDIEEWHKKLETSLLICYFPKRCILQYNENNKNFIEYLDKLPLDYDRLDLLVDASLGTGKQIQTFENPNLNTVKTLAFAGGIHPDNVESILDKISNIDRGNLTTIGIDVESGIRTNDKLDLNKCWEIAKAFSKWAYDK